MKYVDTQANDKGLTVQFSGPRDEDFISGFVSEVTINARDLYNIFLLKPTVQTTSEGFAQPQTQIFFRTIQPTDAVKILAAHLDISLKESNAPAISEKDMDVIHGLRADRVFDNTLKAQATQVSSATTDGPDSPKTTVRTQVGGHKFKITI
jgi:hypothetical protein